MKKVRFAVWMALLALTLSTLAAQAPRKAEKATPAGFLQAYYLENEKSDYGEAARLYEAVAKTAGPEWQAKAKERLEICREELATADYAALMPPSPIAYAQMGGSGANLRSLVEKLGLVAGKAQAPGQFHFGLSPALVDAMAGGRGAAAALTAMDPQTGKASFVAVLYLGDSQFGRGLLDTLLPMMARDAEPIRGFATRQVEDVFVTMTARFLVIGSDPKEIEGVLARIQEKGLPSLSANPAMADALAGRKGDCLFLYVNMKPFIPMIEKALDAMAEKSPQLAMVRPMLDVKSLNAVMAHFSMSGEGLKTEFAVRFDEVAARKAAHVPVSRDLLKIVPEGVVGLLAASLASPAEGEAAAPEAAAANPMVNMVSKLLPGVEGMVLFALPPAADSPMPVPDMVAVVVMRDPAKVQSVWMPMLGVAALAAGGSSQEGETIDIDGTPARKLMFGKVPVFLAAKGNRLYVSVTPFGLQRAFAAERSGRCVADDPAFAAAMPSLGADTVFALLLNAGRALDAGLRFMPPDRAAEVAQFRPLAEKTALSLTLNKTERQVSLRLALLGVPDISGLVDGLIARMREAHMLEQQIEAAVDAKDYDKALGLVDGALAKDPGCRDSLDAKLDILVAKKDDAGAAAVVEKIAAGMWDNARALNNLAWALLTKEKYGQRFAAPAQRLAQRANELSEGKRWEFLDTQARAEFELGHAQQAVELEKKAIAAFAGTEDMEDMQKSLQRYTEAAAK